MLDMRVLLLCALIAATSYGSTIYVSPQGRVAWSGASSTPTGDDGPLPTLSAARDRIRELRRSGNQSPMSVVVRGGTYILTETFTLEPSDSAVTYTAYEGEHPIISGGAELPRWTVKPDGFWQASAAEPVHQLFVNGTRAQRARTPNQGFYRIDGPSSQAKPFVLRFHKGEIKPSWVGAEVVALLAWAEIRMPIVKVNPEAGEATLGGNPRPSNKENEARYWIENAPDGLDAPGEWRWDESTRQLLYKPLPGQTPSTAHAIAPRLTTLIRLSGDARSFVHDVEFYGLEFRHTDWQIAPSGYADTQAAIEAPSAIEATGARNIVIDHCTFDQMGGYAVWFGRGSQHNRVTESEIYDMGGGGIKLGETVMRDTETDQNFDNMIADNEIHDLGIVFPPAVGIWVGQSSRNTLSHNDIHDLYYTAISVGWTWGYEPNQSKGNVIEKNHLHDIGKQMLSDMGAIYTLGVQPGTVIRGNLIHDVDSFTYGGWGIYPDEGSSEILIENNLVYRTKSAGFHQHYGRQNIVRNNIFAFGREHQVMRTRQEPHLSFTFEDNIVYFASGEPLGGRWTGEGFRMNNNLYFDVRRTDPTFAGKTWKQWREDGHDTGSVIADPQFRNPSAGDFRLDPNSPAIKIGFKPFDLSDAGPRSKPGA